MAQDNGSFLMLTFVLNQQRYGLSVMDVVQIIEMVEFTPLPQMPPAVQGVINVRGRVVPIIDLRLRFGFSQEPYHLRTPIILINLEDLMVGFIVDEVEEVYELSPNDIEQANYFLPNQVECPQSLLAPIKFLSGVAKIDRQLIPIISAHAILSEFEQSQLTQITAQSTPFEVPV